MDEEFGPAMRALTEKQRQFVLAMAASPFGTAADWAREAGYSDSGEACKVRGSELTHNPKVQAAVAEHGRSYLNAVGPIVAVTGMLKIAQDPKHKQHLQAIEMIANRVGLHEKVESHVTVEHKDMTGEALAARIKQLGAKYGLDTSKLLGPPVVEAEFKEIE